MQEFTWYWIDPRGQRQGPMSRPELVAAFHRGHLDRDCRLWHEGMREWPPLSRLAKELGIDLPDPEPAPLAPENAANAPPPAIANAQDVLPAGFVRRFLAWFLDSLIVGIGSIVLAIPLTVMSMVVPVIGGVFNLVVGYAAIGCYYAYLESSPEQASIGKRVLGIKVAREDGTRLTFVQALVRWLASALSYLPLCVGFAMAAFTKRKTAMHDLLTQTQVVDKWAYTATPEHQQPLQHANVIGLVLVLVVMPCLVAFGGMIAAITLPTYMEYTLRAEVDSGAALAEGSRKAVEVYFAGHGRFPSDNQEAGLPDPGLISNDVVGSIAVQDGAVVVTYGNKAGEAIRGRTVQFWPENQGTGLHWACVGSTIDERFRPTICRR